MENKSRFQVSESIKYTSKELPPELFELSEENLQQIVGGGGSLWNAITNTVEAKLGARKKAVDDFSTNGKLPTGETARNLIEPVYWGVFRRWWS